MIPQVTWNAPIHQGSAGLSGKWGSPNILSMGIPGSDWLEVPTIYKAYFSGLCKGISPQNMARNMVQYLHVRILKFPLILCLNWPVPGRPPFHNDPFIHLNPHDPLLVPDFFPQYIPWNIYTYPMYITLYPSINWITIWLVIPHGFTCTSYRSTDWLLGFESLYNAQIISQWWLV